jgi:DNA-binding transcriptional regulator YiaG
MNNSKKLVKETRKKLKLTQAEFGALKTINRGQSVVARWESGKIMPDGDMILKIQSLIENSSN